MTISSAATDEHLEQLRAVASSLLASRIESVEEVGGGRNSRVYRLRPSRSSCYALKVYFQHASDSRTRMATEFAGLGFLWDHGVRNVPEPLIASEQHGCAVYAWIEGRKIDTAHASSAMIHDAVSFLAQLAELRTVSMQTPLAPASEACFSGSAIIENLLTRLDSLLIRAPHPELSAFLSTRFMPAFTKMSAWSRGRLGQSFEKELPMEARTLSPSDFGFHNALETEAGEVYFLDFEYFGWDDPAKMVCDFLLHPAMALSAAFKREFAASAISALLFSKDLRKRVEAFYPLFGLKWCLILLNEFLPEHLLRRRFAGMSNSERPRKQSEQLAKAKRMLRQITEEYEHFPYLA